MNKLDEIQNRSIQTTVTFPLSLYIQIIEKSQNEKVSLSEIIRRALYKEFEIRKNN